jgi:hypothetical protein
LSTYFKLTFGAVRQYYTPKSNYGSFSVALIGHMDPEAGMKASVQSSYWLKEDGEIDRSLTECLPPSERHPERSAGMSVRAKDPAATEWLYENPSACDALRAAATGSFAPRWPSHIPRSG